MTFTTSTLLKSYFETGDTPTQAQFENLIDTSTLSRGLLARLSSGSIVTTSIINSVLIYNEAVLDSDSAYDNTTGIYTCPRTGVYSISALTIGTGSVNGDLMKITVIAGENSYGTTHYIAKQSFKEGAPNINISVPLVTGDEITVIVARISGTGTYTIPSDDATLRSTLSIQFLGE